MVKRSIIYEWKREIDALELIYIYKLFDNEID